MLLIGCVQQTAPISFSTLCGLRADQLETMGETDVVQWVKGRYSVSPLRDQISYEGDELVTYLWPDGTALLINGRLAVLSVHRADSGITFDQVVNTLGLPEAVSISLLSTSEATYCSLRLRYPQQGLLLGNDEPTQGGTTAVRLARDSQVTAIDCFAPGTLESLQRLGVYIPDTVVPWSGFGAAVPLHIP